MLRDEMKRGDLAFIYHSSCETPAITGIAEVVKEGYPDHTAFERGHHHFDAGSDPAKPRWYMVDVRLQRRLAQPITLEQLRAHAGKALAGMLILRAGNRLSVTPVEAAHWKFILSLEQRAK
jgi:predicted RNA-binding protein with PUA-like domain